MYDDDLSEILETAIAENINEWKAQGVSDDEIAKRLSQDKINDCTQSLFQTVLKDYDSFFKEKKYEIAYVQRKELNKFLSHQDDIWGDCFVTSETMYVMAVEAAELYSKYVDKQIPTSDKERLKYTFFSLKHIHGRCCQEFLEILHLMRLGFADCAYARWRSMYELCCIAEFIVKYGEDIAKQYYDQSQTDNQKYSWTSGAKDENGQEIKVKNFHDIQEDCQINAKWKKQYKLACFTNHGGPQGTFGRMGLKGDQRLVFVGQSDYGIDVPAEHSAIALSWVSTKFFNVFPCMESLSYIALLHDWVKEIRQIYFDTSDRCFGTNIHYNKENDTIAAETE